MSSKVPDPRRGQTPSCYENTINYIYGSNHPLEFSSAGPASGEAYPAQRAMSLEAFRHWLLAKPGAGAPNSVVVCQLTPDLENWLKQAVYPPRSPAIAVTRGAVAHSLAADKAARDGLSAADFGRLPVILANPRAVLFEAHSGTRRLRPRPTLLYIADSVGGGGRLIKAVVRVAQAAPKEPADNMFVTAGYADPESLRGLELLDGSID